MRLDAALPVNAGTEAPTDPAPEEVDAEPVEFLFEEPAVGPADMPAPEEEPEEVTMMMMMGGEMADEPTAMEPTAMELTAMEPAAM